MALTQTSILTGLEGGQVVPLKEYTSMRRVFFTSVMARAHTLNQCERVFNLTKDEYKRLQSAFQSFTAVICICVKDLADPEILEDFWNLKKWTFKMATSSNNIDVVVRYFKYLTKCCQAIFLRAPLPDRESSFPRETPFKHGCLQFIGDIISSNSVRDFELTVEQFEILAQIAAGTRAGPYPSKRMISSSVIDTIDLIVEAKPVQPDVLRRHEVSLERLRTFLGPVKSTETHISLSNSGTRELPREEGGRGAYLCSHARQFAEVIIDHDEIDLIVGLKDHLGKTPIGPLQAATLKSLDFNLRRGECLYQDTQSIARIAMDKANRLDSFDVPESLGDIILLACSAEMMGFGRFDPEPTIVLDGVPFFQPDDEPVWIPSIESWEVTAALSIEAAGKTRLVTGAVSAYTEIGQLINNVLREYLAQDETLRVGFDEPDKLWETLSAYRKFPEKCSGELFLSADLTEATYSLAFNLLDANLDFIDKVLKDFVPWKTYKNVFRIHQRDVILTQIIRDGYLPESHPDRLTTKHGSFMGDVLSFVHLTLMMSSLVYQAMPGEYSLKDVYMGRSVPKPLSQSVGDDLLVMGVTESFCNRFDAAASDMGVKLSKIHARSPDSMTFCEQYACIPSTPEELRNQYSPSNSVFRNVVFLDTIKGSILTGKSKVKADKSSPFFGHAKMLSKQLSFIVPEWKQWRARVIFWARNFRQAIGIGKAMPHLPYLLGGIEVPLGKCEGFSSENFQTNYLPWLEGMLKLDLPTFNNCIQVLKAIFQANPKGFEWNPNSVELATLISKLEIVEETVLLDKFPDLKSSRSKVDLRRKLKSNGFISVLMLSDELARRDAYRRLWYGQPARTFMTLTTRQCYHRHKDAWEVIRNTVKPVPRSEHDWMLASFEKIVRSFNLRLEGWYFNREDPAIKEAMGGTPSLYLSFD